MRILFANDGCDDAGGVQTYLNAVALGLSARGHDLAIIHGEALPGTGTSRAISALPQFDAQAVGIGSALDRVAAWKPDLCFSHNMSRLDLERGMVERWPVVKFMHGYFGTCISGQKRYGFPVARPCDRRFGAACLALYAPRHCGELRPGALLQQYRWARSQQELSKGYRAIVVASEHMKREFVRNGARPSQVHVNPLFASHTRHRAQVPPRLPGQSCTVAFVGRMTGLKGGDLLVDAVARTADRLGRTIRLLLIGDGPQRQAWEQRAMNRAVPCTAVGWLDGDARWEVLAQALLLVVPSTWPEPFGLVGLEAAALGIPAVAFDVGGVREWLRPGVNGYLAPADPPRSDALADAMIAALRHDDDLARLGARAASIANEMSLDRHLDRLDAIFRVHAHPAGW